MYTVRIRTLGEITMDLPMERAAGYRFDIPYDSLGIPYLPLRKLLQEAGCRLPDIRIGLAQPDGYFGDFGLLAAAVRLLEDLPQCAPFIRGFFTCERYLPDKGYRVRSLKAGQTLYATVAFDEKDTDQIAEALAGIRQIGITEDGIGGEVEITLCDDGGNYEVKTPLSPLCQYYALDYSVTAITPVCFHAPYAEGVKTYRYIPGELTRDELSRRVETDTAIDWDQVICSNAYIANRDTRLLPTPICAAIVKLEKEQFRYRLASDKNRNRIEQEVGLQGTFTEGVSGHLVRYTSPLTEHILTESGEVYDALSSGQIFRGTVYGTDADLRAIAAYIDAHPVTHLGNLSAEGFGAVYRRIDQLREAPVSEPLLVRRFDLCCASHTLILNEEGMPACRAEDLLAEAEYKLGLSGKLKLVGSYVGIYHDNSRNPKWGFERGDTRCFAAGTILRIETDGEVLDISPLRHCFIGERTADGYGEIVSWPAQETYDRLAEKTVPARYALYYAGSSRSLSLGARLTREVIIAMVRNKVRGLALADRPEYKKGHTPEELVPTSILQMFQKFYNPLLTEEEMFGWYEDALKEVVDETAVN